MPSCLTSSFAEVTPTFQVFSVTTVDEKTSSKMKKINMLI